MYSITQHLDVLGQLRTGVRVLDIRAAYLNGDFYVYHGFYGKKLAYVLQQVDTFLDENPGEVVFFGMNRRLDFTRQHIVEVARFVNDTFAGKLFPPPVNEPFNVALNDVLREGGQILMFFDVPGSFPFWPLDSIYSPWNNVVAPDLLISKLNHMFDSTKADKFNNFQAILSPTEEYIAKNMLGNLKQLVTPGNLAVSDWLDGIYENCGSTMVTNRNVTMLSTDFVGDENEVPSKVFRLNKLKQFGGCSGCSDGNLLFHVPLLLMLLLIVCSSV